MKRFSFLASMLGTVLFSASLSSCSSNDNEPAGTPDAPGGGGIPVAEETGLTEELEATYNQDINDFAFNALRSMAARNQGTSLIFSPVSAASVLAILNDGATGQTRQELLKVLGFGDATTKALNEYFQKLMVTAPESDTTTTLRMANAVYANKSCTFLQPFVDDLTKYYQAEAATLDFASPKAKEYINSWCNRQTEGLIPQFVDGLSPETQSMLLNAVYFKGKWVTPFDMPTQKRTFYCEDGTETEQDLMYLSEKNSQKNIYYETDSYQAVRMAYGQGKYAMTFLLPKKGVATTADIIDCLSAQWWKDLAGNLKRTTDSFYIIVPRFSVTTSDEAANLVPLLQSMGVSSLFSPTAEVPNILEGINLSLTEIRQKAVINVTEDSTEAAAVTGADTVGAGEEPQRIIYFYADHPFVYVISDVNTGVIYFAGTYQG